MIVAADLSVVAISAGLNIHRHCIDARLIFFALPPPRRVVFFVCSCPFN